MREIRVKLNEQDEGLEHKPLTGRIDFDPATKIVLFINGGNSL